MWITQQEPEPLTHTDILVRIKQLQSESASERKAGLDSLYTSQIPIDAFELADVVLSVLESDPEPENRKAAVDVLARSFGREPKYAKAVFAALDDSSNLVSEHIANRLYFLLRDLALLPEYLAALRHKNAKVRGGAIYMLQSGPFDPAITQEIINSMSDKEELVRNRAVHALELIGRQSKEQVELVTPVLIDSLKAPERAIAFQAARAIRNFDLPNAEADRVFFSFIQADINSDDQNVRCHGMSALGYSPRGGEQFVDRLVELLEQSDSDLFNAASALAKIGEPARAAIPHLKRVLFTKKRMQEVAKALASLGARDPEIIEWLAKETLGVYPHNVGSVYCAAEGLGYFGKVAVPYLIKGLDWDNGLVQSNTAKQLGLLGKDAIDAVPHLLDVLEWGGGQPTRGTCGAEPYSDVIEALVSIAPEDENVINRIRAIAEDGNDGRCAVAIRALKQIGIDLALPADFVPFHVRHDPRASRSASPPIPEEAQAMLNALTDPDEKVRVAAAASMPPEVVRTFLISLCSTGGRARDVALHSLGQLDPNDLAPTLLRTLPTGGIDDATKVINRIGTDARLAVPPLLRQVREGHAKFKLQPDKQFGYRSEVLDALAKFGPDDERVLECLASLVPDRYKHYQNTDTHMAQAAIAALKSIGSERALGIILDSEREGQQ